MGKKSKLITGVNDLQTLYPEIAAEWNYELNGDAKPNDFLAHSNKSFWWKCHDCGFEWFCSINNRSRGRGCRKCGRKRAAEKFQRTYAERNNFAEHYPDIASEWNYAKNGNKKPSDYSCSSNEIVWWTCSFCGNEWETTINQRTRGRGCPSCKIKGSSISEQAIYYYVKKYFQDAVSRDRSHRYEFDVFIPSINTAIEYDGCFFHGNEKSLEKDNKKDNFCKRHNIRIIRFRDESLPDTVSAIRITFREVHERPLNNALVELYSILGITDYEEPNLERDKIKIISSFRINDVENSVGKLYPHLIEEWYQERNGTLTPFNVSVGSNLKVWWKCKKCEYPWQAAISDRTREDTTACPLCAGKRVKKGLNDLQSQNEELASQWHPTKNGDLKPDMVTLHSGKKVWWLCPVCKHEWESAPSTRANGCGCPVCAGREVKIGFNDLATTNPELLGEWNYKKNDEIGITPYNITKGSHLKVWWVCKSGHEWQSLISNRRHGNGCPECNDIKRKTIPEIDGQIKFEL